MIWVPFHSRKANSVFAELIVDQIHAPENESREDFQRRAQATLQDGEALTAMELQDDIQTIIDEALEKIAKGEF